MEPSDEALVRSAQGGDGEAFAQIVKRYDRRLWGFALSLAGRADLAEEILQDTFARAWRSLGSFDGQKRLAPWLFKIAVNRWRDLKKAGGKRVPDKGEADTDKEASGVLSPLEYSIKRERKEAVAEAVGALTAPLRETVVLFYLDELTYAEISQILGVTPKAVGERLHRARMILRARLRER